MAVHAVTGFPFSRALASLVILVPAGLRLVKLFDTRLEEPGVKIYR
jgi:hypothetical protein